MLSSPDEKVEAVGPIDTEIGILKLEREDGRLLAVYTILLVIPFKAHPVEANTADLSGFLHRR